jgi:N-methylhydantoinase A/oxoprolinase/acetone carboxylase beta subunit
MGSNGGILEADEAIGIPAVAVESGPAAGVVAAALMARQTGRQTTWAAQLPRQA